MIGLTFTWTVHTAGGEAHTCFYLYLRTGIDDGHVRFTRKAGV